MRGLVTGATGFVGGALCRRLLSLGWEVRGLVRSESAGEALTAAGATACIGELGDPNTLAAAANECEVLFHCAGESAFHAEPAALSWINVAGTENAVLAARHAGVKRFVFLSCADVSLWNRDRLHWKENAVLGQAPLGSFARTKLLAEELALHASDRTLSVVALRPAYLWGPGDRNNLPALCQEAARGGVRLFGNGDNLFATTYVENLVDALVAAAGASDVGGQAFHVADAEHHTAREFFQQLCGAIGLPGPRAGIYSLSYATALARNLLGMEGPWPEDVARRGRGSLLDCLRAIQTLGYEPRTSLEAGLAALAQWVKERGGPDAVASSLRPPGGSKDVAHHERLANEVR